MPNASDIVTYIGVPLAVLGVLPILYTAINSFITIRRIKHTLHRNGLHEAHTRGSLMSGVVEVSLPRFSIAPLDREEDYEEYWGLNSAATTLKGGTWTIFNWNHLITGSKLYRLQYSDELQIPQAEIDFEELVSFLLDRGAVPNIKGLHMLRLAGIWTPVGTALLLSPDTTQSALRIAPSNDSDGVLSLALHWNKAWDTRDDHFLPPGWMRLRFSKDPEKDAPEKKAPGDGMLDDEKAAATKGLQLETFPLSSSTPRLSTQKPAFKYRPMSLRIRLGHLGSSIAISNAMWEHENMPLAESPSLDHLRSHPISTWAPPIALALGLSKSLPLYNHVLDPALINFAGRESVPCGVLVTLGLLDESEAPPWETKYDRLEGVHRQHASFMAQQREVNAENMMSPDQARIARTKRFAAENQQRSDQFRQDVARDRERILNRQREAVGSPRVDTTIAANAALNYLKGQNLIDEGDGHHAAIESILVGMVTQDKQSVAVCTLLERWRAWSDRGGMTIEDLEVAANNKLAFCNAACVLGLMKEVSTKEESAVALDMRECVQHWKKVRLG